jgi:hypothetical protein
MEQDDKKEIEKIMMGMTCQKDFECYKSGFRYLCKTRHAGIDDYLIKLRNPRPLGVVRDNWLCPLSAQWYLQILSCPNNHNKGETYEQISKAITCTMALPIP